MSEQRDEVWKAISVLVKAQTEDHIDIKWMKKIMTPVTFVSLLVAVLSLVVTLLNLARI